MLLLMALLGCTGGPVTPDPEIGPGASTFEDADDDGWPAGPDCDDADPAVHPGQEETCNGVDDDCDDATREVAILGGIAEVPDGGTALLCTPTYTGHLRMVDRNLTVRSDGSDVVMVGVNAAQPVVEVLGGRVTLEGVRVHGPLYSVYERSTGILVREGTLTLRDVGVQQNVGLNGGAVVAADGATLILEESYVENNASTGDGGGIGVFDSVLVMTGGTVNYNSSGGDGGAIYAEGSELHLAGTKLYGNVGGDGGTIAAVSSLLTLSDVEIGGSYANFEGGALHLEGSELVAIDTWIWGAAASLSGGAIYLNASDAELVSVDVDDSTTWTGSGGGIAARGTTLDAEWLRVEGNYAWSFGATGGGLDLVDSEASGTGWTVRGNIASGSGGGIRMASSRLTGDGTILIADNDAALGGGAALVEEANELDGVELRGNQASSGGGLYFDTAGQAQTVEATVVDNEADRGGGLYVTSGEVAFDGAVLENTADDGGGAFVDLAGTLAGRADWGTGVQDNTPSDVETAKGASWQADGEADFVCDEAGCE